MWRSSVSALCTTPSMQPAQQQWAAQLVSSHCSTQPHSPRADADQLHYAQRVISEQKAIISALLDMLAAVEAGASAATIMTGSAFQAILQRLQESQRAQRELTGAGSCAEVVRRQFPTLVAQGIQMTDLLGDLSAQASLPSSPPPPPPPPQPVAHAGNPFY
eukprot:scaffold238543_cov36-Tisochrysis_lutea.AAC.1